MVSPGEYKQHLKILQGFVSNYVWFAHLKHCCGVLDLSTSYSYQTLTKLHGKLAPPHT